MNQIKDIVRMVFTTALSNRDIADALQVSPTTVNRYRELIAEKQLTWPQLELRTKDELDNLFNSVSGRLTQKRHPDWTWVHEELQLRGMTLTVLWEEYRLAKPDQALSYSQFVFLYGEYRRRLNPTMRQVHLPGQRAFVDFSGKRPFYIDQATGEKIDVELFIGTLGYSNYVYVEACASQKLLDWLDAHVHMFEAFSGVPQVVVPDNLRSAVTKAGRDGVINRMYKELATHYGTVILPARARKPKDKAKVEGSVLIVQRWVLLRLRHQTFFSLHALNEAIRLLVDELNHRPFKKMQGSRFERFEKTEKATLNALPVMPFEPGYWTATQTVPVDYHVHIAKHWYSVPYTCIGKPVEGRYTAKQVEIYSAGVRIASYSRGAEDGTTTDPTHLPPEHRAYADRTPDKFIEWAASIGPAMKQIVEHQFDRPNPMLGLKVCDAMRSLARRYDPVDLELAAQRAVEIRSLTQKTLASLLKTRLYLRERGDGAETQASLPLHYNIRGGGYFAHAKELES
jgi:transposase